MPFYATHRSLLDDVEAEARTLAGFVQGACSASHAAVGAQDSNPARLALKWELDGCPFLASGTKLLETLKSTPKAKRPSELKALEKAAATAVKALSAFSAYADKPLSEYRKLGASLAEVADAARALRDVGAAEQG